MAYSIVDFAKSLKIDNCKIQNTPNLIFLCGGKTTDAALYGSARDFFNRYLQKNQPEIAKRVRLAEDVNAWFDQKVFPDLLDLENYLADLADVTVLFVESPGSIAELVVFAASEVLRPKTLVVINGFYDFDGSFIADGPLKKIKNYNKELVRYYNWNPDPLNTPETDQEFTEIADDLIEFLMSRDRSHPKQQRFKNEKPGHVLLLLADLIQVAGVATHADISTCLEMLGLKVSREQLACYLSLLRSMDFVTLVRRSNQTFYVSNQSARFVRYAYQPGTPLKDLTSIKAAVRESLETIRRQVLARSLRGPSKKKMPHV